MPSNYTEEIEIIKGKAGEPSRILADFLAEHSTGFYAGGKPKDAVRIRRKYIAQIEALLEKAQKEAVGASATPKLAKQPSESKSLTDAQEFVASIAVSDTALGGYLAMYPLAQKTLAQLFFQFANPHGYLEQLTGLVATDSVSDTGVNNPHKGT